MSNAAIETRSVVVEREIPHRRQGGWQQFFGKLEQVLGQPD
jgi:hypothetical protein